MKTTEETNDLRFSTSVSKGNELTRINIRLNDKCKNGHQDFSMTCDIYDKFGHDIGGGCAHDHINKITNNKYKIFELLHLSDANGIPMYAVENGFYHLKEGKMDAERFCEYYRMSAKQYSIISKSENKLEYAILLKDLGILAHWKEQADEAIKFLEELTGKTFVNDSKKSQYHAPEVEAIKEFETKKANGFYSDEKKKSRAKEDKRKKKADKIQSLKDKAISAKKKIDLELYIDILSVQKLGADFNNEIYYNHTNKWVFNWQDDQYHTQLNEKQFDKFCNSITQAQFKKLPNGIEIELKGVKKYTRD